MLVVKVELHSAITGRVTEKAVMRIYNDGNGTPTRGDYVAETFREGADVYSRPKPVRRALVLDYPRKKLHVWNLVARALGGMNYR